MKAKLSLMKWFKSLQASKKTQPEPKRTQVRASTWAYGPSFFTQSYLLESPDKTLERIKEKQKADAEHVAA